jgi:hypothetical protein
VDEIACPAYTLLDDDHVSKHSKFSICPILKPASLGLVFIFRSCEMMQYGSISLVRADYLEIKRTRQTAKMSHKAVIWHAC